MFRKLKLIAVGLLDRRHLYRTADAVVQEIARRLDAYYDVWDSYADDRPHSAYFKVYKFKGGTVQLRYLEDGKSLVEIAVFIRQGCVYPPREKWAPMQYPDHGQGYRVSIYNEQLLRSTIAEVTEWCINNEDAEGTLISYISC